MIILVRARHKQPGLKGKGVGAVVGRRYLEERLGIRGETGWDKVLDTFYLSRTSSYLPHTFCTSRTSRSVLVHPPLPSSRAPAATREKRYK